MSIPVVALVRVSTLMQAGDGKLNIAAQHHANEQTCARFGLDPIQTFEIVESGKTVASSPEMQQVLDLCVRGRVRGIVLPEQSRLTRPDNLEDMAIFQVLKENNVQLYLPDGPVDLNSEAGFLSTVFKSVFDGMEIGRIRTRTQSGIRKHRERGDFAGGAVPFGLAWDGQWSYTDDIARVREMFRLFLSGQRCISDIARLVGTRRSQVDHALRNPTYSGWLVYDTCCDTKNPMPSSTRKRKNFRRVARDEVLRVRLSLEPVISETDFAEVQRILTDARRERANKKRKDRLQYLRYVICPECMRPMASKNGKSGAMDYYSCCTQTSHAYTKKGVPRCGLAYQQAPKLDGLIDEAITDAFTDPQHLARAVAAYNARIAQHWQRLQPLLVDQTQRRTALEAKRRRVIDNFEDGDITREEKREKLAAIQAEIDVLGAQTQVAYGKPCELDAGQVRQIFIDGFEDWKDLTRVDKRAVLEAVRPLIFAEDYRIIGIALPLGPLAIPSGRDDAQRLRSRLNVAPLPDPKADNNFLYIPLAA